MKWINTTSILNKIKLEMLIIKVIKSMKMFQTNKMKSNQNSNANLLQLVKISLNKQIKMFINKVSQITKLL